MKRDADRSWPFARTWRVGVWVLLAIWVVTLSLTLRLTLLDVGLPTVYAQAGDPHPSVRAIRPYANLGDSALRPGDTLLAIDGESLAGVGAIGFLDAVARPIEPPGVPVVVERGGVRLETHLPLLSMRLFHGSMLLSAALGLACLAIFLRARPTPAIRWGIPAMLMLAIQAGGHASAVFPWPGLFVPLWLAALALEAPLLLCAVTYFPEQDGRDLAWVRRWGWIAVVHAPLAAGAAYGALLPPVTVALPLIMAAGAIEVGAIVAILTRNYLRSDAIGRRQLRWTLLGVQVASLPLLLVAPLAMIEPRYVPWMFDSLSAFVIVPVFLVISILRYNWFDVDRLLSATASYNLLGVGFVGLGLLLAPRVGRAATAWLGVPAETGQTLTAFALAAAAFPTYQRLQPRIERVFFPERHAIDERAARLLAELDEVANTKALCGILGAGLSEGFRTDSLVLYAPEGDGWGSVYVHGRAVPPALDARSTLPERARQGRALDLAGPDAGTLAPVDQALLETLGTRVVLPVCDAGALRLIVCLGGKGSGDVYTPTDLRLLEAVAYKAAAELRRFGEDRRARDARELQERLRRFVPGAVAEQLLDGRELGARECDVSVLFVDIRGYTSWAEGRDPADVFSTVSRYTETASGVVTRHRGSVVEFNGDGMMAVFGAPEPLADKERAAVAAAIELCAAVPAIGAPGEIAVGVGVATGPAFAGAIRAVDRLIWSAVGSTTNLAARLQAMTRDLDAAVLIDEATWRAAGDAAAAFEPLDDVPVRGRRERLTVYRRGATSDDEERASPRV